MKHTTLLFAATLLLAGCATMAKGFGGLPPGYGVPDQVARDACGDLETFRAKVQEAKAEFQGPPLVPDVGDSLCEVLAKLGGPDDGMHTQVQGGETLTLYYYTGTPSTGRATHLVEISPGEDGRGRVTAVVW